jgi:hypothetical protein
MGQRDPGRAISEEAGTNAHDHRTSGFRPRSKFVELVDQRGCDGSVVAA